MFQNLKCYALYPVLVILILILHAMGLFKDNDLKSGDGFTFRRSCLCSLMICSKFYKIVFFFYFFTNFPGVYIYSEI